MWPMLHAGLSTPYPPFQKLNAAQVPVELTLKPARKRPQKTHPWPPYAVSAKREKNGSLWENVCVFPCAQPKSTILAIS